MRAQTAEQDVVQPFVHFMIGYRLPGGVFGFGGGVELHRWAIPSLQFGLGGGPDGGTVAFGNDMRIWRHTWLEVRSTTHVAYAFGRVQEDEFVQGYRTTTDPSTSVKLGAAFMMHSKDNFSFVLLGGYSWALNVPNVTVERPGTTTTSPADDAYFSDEFMAGISVYLRL